MAPTMMLLYYGIFDDRLMPAIKRNGEIISMNFLPDHDFHTKCKRNEYQNEILYYKQVDRYFLTIFL